MMPPLFDGSRLFHVPPGLAFPEAFARGLAARLRGRPPLDAARIEVLVPSARAATLVDRALAAHLGPDALLPAVRVVGALADHPAAPVLPPAVSPLRRMLRLSELVRAFLDRRPEIAPPSARFALAEALAALLDELQAAGLGPDALDRIDVAQHARHWQTTRDFVGIIADHWPAILAEEEGGALDPEAREARALEGIAARWSARPPDHPVIVAGSTGSRPLTARLMALVAGLPQGALVLPGFDSWLDPAMHQRLGPDHPQAAMAALLGRIGADPAAVAPWDAAAPCPERNRLISLALQPAPVTDRWLDAAPALAEILPAATAGLALVEAPGRRQEALAVALMMRETLERPGATVALITPDRQLARAVTAALARWDLVPDDSAGRPLGQTPPGIFLRLVARLAGGPPAAGALIELAKHPLCGGEGAARREHMRRTASLELFLRRNAIPLADPGAIRRWAAGRPAQAGAWAAWICDAIAPLAQPGALEVSAAAARLRGVAEALAAGPGGDPGRLWRREDGAAALELVSELAQAAGTGAMLEPAELARLLDELMAARNVPPADPARPPDPRLRILGNREARLETADRVILGGLTEGVWPALPGADPWLSRPMRRELGLAAPERGIGLAAHDFATAIGAPEVIVTRAARIDGVPALPSRWLVRLENLLLGCGEAGARALEGMRARGREWLRLAARLDRPAAPVPPAPRP
ncbi:MAG: double-strand break repair protein AddB, partial [Alphaproteobacteria bacterium]